MYTTDVRSVSVCTADVHHVTMYTTNVHYIQKMNSMYRVSKKDKTITDCNLYTTVHMRYEAPFNPKTSTFIHKSHPYTVNLNSATSGDSANAFPHRGGVLSVGKMAIE